MSKNNFPLHVRIRNKIKGYYRYLVRSRNATIYHCCIQKSGSQWFKKVFNDEIVWRNTHYAVYSPKENFITQNEKLLKRLKNLPKKLIVGPLYIRYNHFSKMKKPKNYKTFFVARDPRDLIISNYFSLKYSHSPYDPYIIEMREKLNNMPQNDGISEIINSFTEGINKTLDGWFLQKSDNIILIKFEDLFGKSQTTVFSDLLKFCGINLNQKEIKSLLEEYSFQNISGRQLGNEDVKDHYRKGTPGDWKNYFTDEHKKLFKKLAGDMLITCGYEKNDNW